MLSGVPKVFIDHTHHNQKFGKAEVEIFICRIFLGVKQLWGTGRNPRGLKCNM